MSKHKAECSHCGAKIVQYKHSLNVGLRRGLKALYEKGGTTSIDDLGLNPKDYTNFQKLQYWDLTEKAKDDEGKRLGGIWRITHRGIQFVENKIFINRSVWSYRGKRVRYDGEMIGFSTSPKDFYKTAEEYAKEAIPVDPKQEEFKL